MGIGKLCHQKLELVPALYFRGRQQILYQLEHADDVPLFIGAELRNQQDSGCQHAFRRIIEKGILPIAGAVSPSR